MRPASSKSDGDKKITSLGDFGSREASYGSNTTVSENTAILHSLADEVVPFADRLADEEPLAKMVEAVETTTKKSGK